MSENKENEQLEKVKESKKEEIAAVKEADLQKKVADGIQKKAAEMNDMMNNMLSSLAQPIFDIIEKFKPVPPKLRSIVDVQGAANGLYKNMQQLDQSTQAFLKTVMIEEEVPITLDDYDSDPSLYPDLMDLETEENEVTEADCAESGYTKIVQTLDPQWMQKLISAFPKPEERDIVAQQMEKLINTSIKLGWKAIQPAVKTIGAIVPIDPINTAIDAVITSIDGVVKIASQSIPEEKLNEMIAKKKAAEAKAQDNAENATKEEKSLGQSAKDLAKKSLEQSKNAISSVGAGVKDGISGAFKNLKAPKLPDDIKAILEEMKDAIIFVKDNISNIYTVLILKMINQIVGCFKQVVDAIGVPDIPNPLGQIPQIAQDAYTVFKFVMGLPMSLISCIESILVRKWKMIQVCQTPALPDPLSKITSLPSTAADVSYPDVDLTKEASKQIDKVL